MWCAPLPCVADPAAATSPRGTGTPPAPAGQTVPSAPPGGAAPRATAPEGAAPNKPLGPAATDPAPIPRQIEAKSPATRREFYGWPILAIGGAGGLLAAASIALPDLPFNSIPSVAAFVIGAPTYGLAGPIVHWSHGYFEKGLISFMGNIGLPVLVGAVGASISCGHDSARGCSGDGWARGAAIGMLVAPVLDALILGWEDAPVDYIGRTDRRAPHLVGSAHGLTVSPSLVFRGGITSIGVTGRY